MIRRYRDSDYAQLKALYQHSELYGGEFSEHRDGRKVLAKKINTDPDTIWVYETDGELAGTISVIDDSRVAWLYRFVVRDHDQAIATKLYDKAVEILKARGHEEVLVYTSADEDQLLGRYESLGMNRGDDYTCYWVHI